MRVVHLSPNSQGHVLLTLSVFTNKDLGIVDKGEFADTIRPIDMQIEVQDAGYFDMDTIEKIVKEKYDPQGNVWSTKDNNAPLFVPMSADSVEELQENGVFVPTATAATKAASNTKWRTAITIADNSRAGSAQPVMRSLTFKALKEDSDSSLKLPSFPVSVSVGGTNIIGSGKTTGNYKIQDYSRFCCGIFYKGSFYCGLPIPIGVDHTKLLKYAHKKYTDTLSPFVYNPPTPVEWETTPALFRQLQKECSRNDKIPLRLSLLRFTMLQYMSDGGEVTPEAVNCNMYDKKINDDNDTIKFAKLPAKWVLAQTGDIIQKKAPDYSKFEYGKAERGNDGYPSIYVGKAVAVRFFLELEENKHATSFKNCVSFAIKHDWYEEMLKEHRPDVLEEVWERPNLHGEEIDFFFMCCDWCMRNDANVKRGTGSTIASGEIDLYSQPKRTMYQWIIGAYRQQFQKSHKEFPGVKVFKHKIPSKDLEALMNYNQKISSKPPMEAAAPLKVPTKKG